MSHPKITIRYGAVHDDITVDGHVFDRSRLTKADGSFVRRVVVGGLEKSGYFHKGGQK